MAESETSSPVFRSTSLTRRQRLTPARACSPRTRIRPNFRLVRFSAAVRSPPRGFFFRLARLGPCGLVPLEAAILVQHGAWRRVDPLLIGDRLVRHPPLVGLTPEVEALARGVRDHHVLIAGRLLPTAGVRQLFFRVFWPLTASFGAV